MNDLSDDELRRRLEAYDFCMPPITSSTRNVLVKKLEYLDKEKKRKNSDKKCNSGLNGKKPFVRQSSINLLDYSSADDEVDVDKRKSFVKPKIKSNYAESPLSRKNVRLTKAQSCVNGYTLNDSRITQFSDEKCGASEAHSRNVNGRSREGINRAIQTSSYLELDGSSCDDHDEENVKSSVRFSSSTPLNQARSVFSLAKGPNISNDKLSSIESPELRRQIVKNPSSFGSLGEALSTLPSSNWQHSERRFITPVASPPLRRPSLPAALSFLIIAVAVSFFVAIGISYIRLQPPSLTTSVCGEEPSCSQVQLYVRLMTILNNHATKTMCENIWQSKSAGRDQFFGSTALSYEEVVSGLGDMADEDNLNLLIDLLVQKPHWGITVHQQLEGYGPQQPSLEASNPSLSWRCWLTLKVYICYYFLCNSGLYCIYASISCAFLWVAYRIYYYRQQKSLRQEKIVFEMVGQILPMIMEKPFVAINHVRDHLIAPQDRNRLQNIWQQAVDYIRQNESRVRENIRQIYGEPTRVWQWLPDRSPPQSTSWQGSAFNSLNKNVASPLVAPTTCLKIRRMFNGTLKSRPSASQISEVKKEVIRRCQDSAILHVTVVFESQESCVYIKTASAKDAGLAFKSLHGQWYKGNLVTVKYLREERYCQRFPDSVNCITPLHID